MSSYSFSPSQVLFYANSLRESVYEPNELWPSDAIDIDDKTMMIYTSQPPEGKTLGSVGGRPAWVDLPPPTQEELVLAAELYKTALRNKADAKIAPLQDSVDLDMATEEETMLYSAWRKYRVLLNRVDTSTAPDIEWPIQPDLEK